MLTDEALWAEYFWNDLTYGGVGFTATPPNDSFQALERSRMACLEVNERTYSNTDAAVLEFKDFKEPIRVSHPIRVSSRVKVNARLKVLNYKVATSLGTTYHQERTVYYDPDTPCYTQVSGPHSFDQSGQYTKDASSVTVLKLPNQYGTATYYNSVPQSGGAPDFTKLNQAATHSTLRLPHAYRGTLPRKFKDESTITPETIAYSLYLFSSYDQEALPHIVLILKELIFQAYRFEWLQGTKSYEYLEVANQGYSSGFPASFNLTEGFTTFAKKPIWSNALLGLALIKALQTTQDVYPLGTNKLYGAYSTFKTSTIELIKALAHYCALAYNPITMKVSAFSQNGTYSYDQPSYQATILTTLFLNAALSYFYDSRVWSTAARLKQNIDANSVDPSQPYWLADVEGNLTDAIPYSILYSLHYDPSSVETLLDQYNALREESLASDPLQYFLARASNLSTPDGWWGDDYTALDLSSLSDASLDTLALLKLGQLNFNPVVTLTPLLNEAASAVMLYSLAEIRRSMPNGLQWFSSDAINSIYSNIGSLLYGQASIQFDAALSILSKEGQTSPLLAVSQSSQDLLAYVMGGNPYLCSDTFIMEWLRRFLNTDYPLTPSILQTLLESLFPGISIEYLSPEEPFCLYTNSQLTEYGPAESIFSPDSVTTEQYLAIAYRGRLTSLGSFRGIEPRPVPGFPYDGSSQTLAKPVVSLEDYLADPSPDVYVEDWYGYVIDPLINYYPTINVNLTGLPDFIGKVLRTKLPLPLRPLLISESSN